MILQKKIIYQLLGKNQMKHENYFLKQLIEKTYQNNNLNYLINYRKLNYIINNDQRYNGIKRCFVESGISNTCIIH